MKRNIAVPVFFLVALSCDFTFAQTNLDLELGALKAFYHNDDTVSLFVQNMSDRKYYVVIALEKENGDEWAEVLDDIDREGTANFKNVLILDPGQKRIIKWVPSDLFCQFCHERKLRLKGRYRVKVKYGSEVTDIECMGAHTSGFILK